MPTWLLDYGTQMHTSGSRGVGTWQCDDLTSTCVACMNRHDERAGSRAFDEYSRWSNSCARHIP